MPTSESLPADLATAHAMIVAERQACLAAEAEAANAQADLSSSEALIAHLKLENEKLRRTLYGPGSADTISRAYLCRVTFSGKVILLCEGGAVE